jgi:hypothetical protein
MGNQTLAIIIAAGQASRWAGYLGIPKHLIEIDGEPIIHRAVRLLQERGVDDVYVVGPPGDSRYVIPGSQLYVPVKNTAHHDADKFLNSKTLWNSSGRTLVVYGDVYFTDAAMDRIVGYEEQSWTLFCRFGPSKLTGTNWGECFVQSFYPQDVEEHELNLLYIADLKERQVINRCGGWEHYRAMNGMREYLVRNPHKRYGKYVEIDDWTDDFDRPVDYDRFIANRKNKC